MMVLQEESETIVMLCNCVETVSDGTIRSSGTSISILLSFANRHIADHLDACHVHVKMR